MDRGKLPPPQPGWTVGSGAQTAAYLSVVSVLATALEGSGALHHPGLPKTTRGGEGRLPTRGALAVSRLAREQQRLTWSMAASPHFVGAISYPAPVMV